MKTTTLLFTVHAILVLFLLPIGAHAQLDLVLNEIHADPVNSIEGDANGDGMRDNVEDEFLEFINTGATELDLSGLIVADNNSDRHTFPNGTILIPGRPLVLFGGGAPLGVFGNALVQTASTGGLSLTNGGDEVIIKNPAGDTVFFYAYGDEANIDESITRSPDITGTDDPMTAHSVAANDTTNLYSPGTQIDGSPFPFDLSALSTTVEFSAINESVEEQADTVQVNLKISNPDADVATQVEVRVVGGTGSAIDISNFATVYNLTFPAGSTDPVSFDLIIEDDLDPEGEETFIYAIRSVSGPSGASIGIQDSFTLTILPSDLTFPLLINEIHADPKPGLEGDANGDGVRVFQEDEFIEFVNIADTAVDVSGFTYEDSRGIVFHVFPDGTVVQPGEVLVLFGRPLDIQLDPADFCGATLQFASESSVGDGEGLSLTNGGDALTIRDSTGQVVILESYGEEGGNDQSINRQVDAQRTPFELHTVLAGDTANLFSPGCSVLGGNITGLRGIARTTIKLFPNPTTGQVSVELPTGTVPQSLTLYDLSGRMLMVKPGNTSSIDVSAFANGLYLVEVKTQSGTFYEKLQVQRGN